LACNASSSTFTAKRTGGSSSDTEGSTYGFPLPGDSPGDLATTGFACAPFADVGGGRVGRLIIIGGSDSSSSSSKGGGGAALFAVLSFLTGRGLTADVGSVSGTRRQEKRGRSPGRLWNFSHPP